MQAPFLHHVTLKTAKLSESLRFYERHLGLKPGPRPPFDVPGAWLYPAGSDAAILHLIEIPPTAAPDASPMTGMFDHFAICVTGLGDYLARVRADDGWYRATPVPGTDLVQIHHHDPNGVMVEATFVAEPIDPRDVRD